MTSSRRLTPSHQRQSSTFLQNNHNHLHFSTHQPPVQRTNSLRKIDSVQPTFTPAIHEMPFQIYP